MNRTVWWVVAGAALPMLAGSVLLLGVAAWIPIAQQHSEEVERGDMEWAGSSGGALAEGAVPDEYREALLNWGSHCPTLTPARLAAQIQTESAWRPDAHNETSGARGMAQFLPGTWAEYGTDGDGDGTADIVNPLDAIASAAVYDCAVARMVKDVPGDPVDLMLAAYNAGPGAVLHAGGVPNYTETRNYIRKIRDLETRLAGAAGVSEEPAAGEAAAVLRAARSQIGVPYVWGGGGSHGPTGGGFDCSGLTQYAVYQGTSGRIELPRTSQTQRGAGRPVSRDQMQPGDLIVINNDGAWGHVGIYAGGGRMIHAPRTGRTIAEDPLEGYWSQFPWDIRRVL